MFVPKVGCAPRRDRYRPPPMTRSSSRRARRTLLPLIAAAAAVAAAAPPASAGVPDTKKLPTTFAGIVTEDAFAQDGAARQATLAAQRAAGVRLIRQTFDWGAIEPAPGVFDFAKTDQFVVDAARNGMSVMPILFGAPSWGTSRPAGDTTHGTYPPRDRLQFAAFATAVAKRYGRTGTLWNEHPEVPRTPVVEYQVWNEPNLTIYWLPKVDPKAYTLLVDRTGKAIKQVDPQARIVLAGMPPNSHLGMKLATYLDRMYTAKAKGKFDVVAINAYATSSTILMKYVRQAHQVSVKRRDATAGTRITEFGWAAGGPAGTYNPGPARQASLISATIKAMGKERRALRLQGFSYYGWRDLPPYEGRTDFWGLHTGLHWIDGTPKPAAASFSRAVLALK
jgi:polysaccharide biosynthesis protein PslG